MSRPIDRHVSCGRHVVSNTCTQCAHLGNYLRDTQRSCMAVLEILRMMPISLFIVVPTQSIYKTNNPVSAKIEFQTLCICSNRLKSK